MASFSAVTKDGNRVPPPPNRARAILTALILSETNAVKRSALVVSIWPDSSPESRKVRLRQELANLRTFLESLECQSALTVNREEICLDISNIQCDFLRVNSAINAFESEPTENIAHILPLLSKYGNSIPAPDLHDLFSREQRRFTKRIETTRMLLARVLLENERQQDALRVLTDVIDKNPENPVAITLRDTILLNPVPRPAISLPNQIGNVNANVTKHRTDRLKAQITILSMVALSIVMAFFAWQQSSAKLHPMISASPIVYLQIYKDKAERDEFPNSEGTSAFTLNGYMAVAGFTKTHQDDVDGLTLLLDTSGRLLWRNRFSSASHDCDRFFQVSQDTSGNVYSAGESYLTKPEVDTEGWYGRVVAYTRYGKQRFATHTKLQVANTNGVVRVVPTEDGGCRLYTTTLYKNRYFIMASQFSPDGKLVTERLLNTCAALLSDVRVASDGSQYVFGTAEIASGTAAHRDWFVTKLNSKGENIWSEHLDGPAAGNSDDERCTGILDVKDSVMLYGLMEWPLSSNVRAKQLYPTIANLDATTGNVIKLTKVPTNMTSPLVRCWDIYSRTQILMVLVPLRDTGAQTIEWYLVHKASGEVEQKGSFDLPKHLTGINALTGNVTMDGAVTIDVAARPNRAGTLPTAIVRADVSPYGQPKLTLIEHSGILKLASQTNGQVVGQIEEKPDHTALFITNRTAGSRQQ